MPCLICLRVYAATGTPSLIRNPTRTPTSTPLVHDRSRENPRTEKAFIWITEEHRTKRMGDIRKNPSTDREFKGISLPFINRVVYRSTNLQNHLRRNRSGPNRQRQKNFSLNMRTPSHQLGTQTNFRPNQTTSTSIQQSPEGPRTQAESKPMDNED